MPPAISKTWSTPALEVSCKEEPKIRTSLPKEPTREELSLTKILYALSNDVRLAIVKQLERQGPCPCGLFEVDRPKPSLSHHFRVLREPGLVSTDRQGRAFHYEEGTDYEGDSHHSD